MNVRIAFLGDTLLGGEAQAVLDEKGPAYALDGIAPLVAGTDLVVANHEGPLTSRDHPQIKVDLGRKRYWYRARPEAASALARAGVGMVSLANNHVMDFGWPGLADTLECLDEAGIAHCGAGVDAAAALRPAIVTVGDFRVGFISIMQRYQIYLRERLYASKTRPGPARLRLDDIGDRLAALRAQSDLAVVLVHWGRNYRPVDLRQEQLARALCHAGAHVIVGHHPHIPQRLEVIGTTPVLYSLGNGALGTPGRFHSGRPPYGLVAIVDAVPGSVRTLSLKLLSVDNAIVGFRPRPADPAAAAEFLPPLLGQTASWQWSDDGWLVTTVGETDDYRR